jgi:hypothetical protein
VALKIHRVVQNPENLHFVCTRTDQEDVARLLDPREGIGDAIPAEVQAVRPEIVA